MASASISPRPWRASARRRPPVRFLRHHSPGSDPLEVKLIAEPGTSAKAATRSATSRSCGRNGTANTATPCARYWKGDEGQLAELGYRLTGSSDLYQHDGRRPYASINFVTAHDGFTLHDLVSYNEKHNEANGENNQDGSNDNDSWNMGVEGEPTIEAINQAARPPKAQLPGHADAVAGRADDLRRRRIGRTQTATTTPMPGQRDQLVRLEAQRGAQAAAL